MITTPADLAARMGIDRETLAIAAQTVPGGVDEYLRQHITRIMGEMSIAGPHPSGKGVERYGACWERVTGKNFDGRKKRANRTAVAR